MQGLRRFTGLIAAVWLAWTGVSCSTFAAPAPEPATLRVQLPWTHQAEFAGFYAALEYGYFREQGLSVELLAGGPGINPVERLQAGSADIALTLERNAFHASSGQGRIIEFAELFAARAASMICRRDVGVSSPHEIAGKRILLSPDAPESWLVREMLSAVESSGGPAAQVFVSSADRLASLRDARVDCIFGMAFNEPALLAAGGLPLADQFVVQPMDLAVPYEVDGLFARESALRDPEGRKRLAAFVLALQRGWKKVREAPAAALLLTMRRSGGADVEHQRRMLDRILVLLPADVDALGAIDVAHVSRVERGVDSGRPVAGGAQAHGWTGAVMDLVQEARGSGRLLANATSHYLRQVVASQGFRYAVVLGIWIYALAGALLATELGLNIVGRVATSGIACLGGGIMRDILIGGERMPPTFLKDPLLPVGVLVVVLLASAFSAVLAKGVKNPTFQAVKRWSELLGYSAVAIYGAVVPLVVGLAWYWAPFFAWLSCNGGAIVRDVVIGRNPIAFRNKILDESTLLGGAALALFLSVANRFEHEPHAVAVAMGLAYLVVLLSRYQFSTREIWYPDWLHHRS
ncbi:MAG: hypothetical protein RLZZ393_1666 [Pseudomonadota bacterium]|jgi:ABC-type nitrate/sulfonate/bicarbonate transport system substrate-binding protein/uncharacterized membrane protein YeiH